ncbi:MAG TPA: histidine kinase dimerization/phosphoacceptor domain -containing protein [Devosia sp.]|jgi:two-component sensor histidine kinase|nr:histidine kinase dimerization/phosphoacceptor domain -containing protein [Devosia sp.]
MSFKDANLTSTGEEAARLAAVRRYDILDTPPDGSFDRITALAASLFSVPISIISLVDADRVWFKSHHGLEGVKQIGKEPGLCASAIVQDQAWVLENAATDIRSLANPLVAGEFGLRFYAGVPLTTTDGYNLGTLCVIDREPRPVTENQISQLRHLASLVMDQMELRLAARQAVSELSGALETARILGQEIDHRVMNSLQLVSSMLQLQARQVEGSHAAEQLQVAALRVASVARVHQHIFRNQSAGAVKAQVYIENLVSELGGTLNAESPILVDVQPASLAADLLVPLGLILNELVINATKHGGGKIVVRFQELSPGKHRLTVANSGERLSLDFNPARASGLGMKVVVALARQLGGTLEYGAQEDGTGAKFWVDFPALKDTIH